jgi:hypothetical protein
LSGPGWRLPGNRGIDALFLIGLEFLSMKRSAREHDEDARVGHSMAGGHGCGGRISRPPVTVTAPSALSGLRPGRDDDTTTRRPCGGAFRRLPHILRFSSTDCDPLGATALRAVAGVRVEPLIFNPVAFVGSVIFLFFVSDPNGRRIVVSSCRRSGAKRNRDAIQREGEGLRRTRQRRRAPGPRPNLIGGSPLLATWAAKLA